MAKKVIPTPGEGLQFIFDNTGLVHMKESVDTYNSLPVTGNTENDLRITRDTDTMYTWSIASASGDLSDWFNIGPITSIDWSAITGKPVSTPAEIDAAVANVDQDVTSGSSPVFNGANITNLDAPTKADWKQNGFENITDSSLAWSDSTPDRTLSIQPTGVSFDYFIEGVKYTSTGDTVQITDTEGIHIIYYDGASLTALANPTSENINTLIKTKALVSIIYWNVSASTAIYVGEERHGKIMSPSTHAYLHFTEGLRYLNDLGLNTINADGSGATTDAQFGVDAGAVTDEDLYLAISSIGSTTGLPIYYMLGALEEWQKYTEAGFSIRTFDGTSATRMTYNQYTGGAWQLTEVANNDFALCHVFATTEKDNPMIAIMGQGDYATIPQAREGAETEIKSLVLNDILFPEIHPIATIIFQTNLSYANTVNARIRSTGDGDDYIDWRDETISRTEVSTTNHNSLTGKQGGQAGEYYHLTNDELIDTQDAISKKHTQNTDTGTSSETFAIDSDASGFEAVKIKNESGIMAARNNADSDYVVMRGDDPVNDNDLVNKGWLATLYATIVDAVKNSNNIMINAFRIAINGSLTVFNMIDGFVDEYEDESGIDNTASTNELYDSTDDFYEPDGGTVASVSPYAHYKLQDDLPSSVVIDSKSVQNGALASGNSEDYSIAGKIGKALSAPGEVVVDGLGGAGTTHTFCMWIKASSTSGYEYIYDQSDTMTLCSNFNGAGLTFYNGAQYTFGANNIADGNWHWLCWELNSGAVKLYIDNVQYGATKGASTVGLNGTKSFFAGDTGNNPFPGAMEDFRIYKSALSEADRNLIYNDGNGSLADKPSSSVLSMDLISESVSAETEPDSGRIIILEEDVSSITLNTDIKAYASKDDGSTWAQITLTDEGNYDTDKRILVGNADLDVSGIGSGTNMVYKLTTHNQKSLKIHGTALSWGN